MSSVSLIYVAENTDLNKDTVTSSTEMFASCPKLVGGNGTVFDSTKLDKTYARVDSADAPGYFTVKK